MNLFYEQLQNIIKIAGLDANLAVFDNTITDYIGTAIVFVLALAVFKAFQFFVVQYLRRLALSMKHQLQN